MQTSQGDRLTSKACSTNALLSFFFIGSYFPWSIRDSCWGGGGGGGVLNETPGSEWVRGYRSSHGNTAGRTSWVSMSNGTDLNCVLNNLI